MSRGFTLIELLVVTAIIALMTALILSNYRSGDQSLALQRSASKLAQDLRRAQELALSSREFNDEVPAAYGIYFNISDPTHYVLFADIDDDQQYDSPSEKVEEVSFEKKIQLTGLDPVSDNSLTIIFTPPDPAVFFFPDAPISKITIGMAAISKIVEVNKAGLITVE